MKQDFFLRAVYKKATEDLPLGFTGLGIILIENELEALPISPLLSEDDCHSISVNSAEIVDFLFSISTLNDKRHDGFHIVSQKSGILKISQYFSPLIPNNFNKTVFNVGARYRTAQYGSLHENVTSIIVVSQNGKVSIAKDGAIELLII